MNESFWLIEGLMLSGATKETPTHKNKKKLLLSALLFGLAETAPCHSGIRKKNNSQKGIKEELILFQYSPKIFSSALA